MSSKVYADNMGALQDQHAKLQIKYDAALALEALPAQKGEQGTLLEPDERVIAYSPKDPRKRPSKSSLDDDMDEEVKEELDYGTP